MRKIFVIAFNYYTFLLRGWLRVIALSATLPNLCDIGDWLSCDAEAVHFFDDSFRPIPLTIHTVAFGSAGNPFLFEKSLDSKVSGIIERFADGKQVLIFCSSKKSTEKLSAALFNRFGRQHVRVNSDHSALLDATKNIQDNELRRLADNGYGYHHGGLSPDDRMMVEILYLNGKIHILCSTSTLAHGVNLPAHLVIVKVMISTIISAYFQATLHCREQIVGGVGLVDMRNFIARKSFRC